MKIYILPLPLSPSTVRFLSPKHIVQREKLIMQNYLAARYRRVHDRIKDVGISDLRGKFSKVRSTNKSDLNSYTSKFSNFRRLFRDF